MSRHNSTDFIVLEIVNLRKAIRMVLEDFPNLTAEQLEIKRREMRLSAWWLLGGATFLVVAGNLSLMLALAFQSEMGIGVSYAIGIGGFLISLVISAIHGTRAARLK